MNIYKKFQIHEKKKLTIFSWLLTWIFQDKNITKAELSNSNTEIQIF